MEVPNSLDLVKQHTIDVLTSKGLPYTTHSVKMNSERFQGSDVEWLKHTVDDILVIRILEFDNFEDDAIEFDHLYHRTVVVFELARTLEEAADLERFKRLRMEYQDALLDFQPVIDEPIVEKKMKTEDA
jgi:hypothetical protein